MKVLMQKKKKLLQKSDMAFYDWFILFVVIYNFVIN